MSAQRSTLNAHVSTSSTLTALPVSTPPSTTTAYHLHLEHQPTTTTSTPPLLRHISYFLHTATHIFTTLKPTIDQTLSQDFKHRRAILPIATFPSRMTFR